MKCIVGSCIYNKRPHPPGISYHKFPKNKILRKQWVEAVGVSDCSINKSSYVCSEHFLEEDMYEYATFMRLNDEAIPQIKLTGNHENKIETAVENEVVEDDFIDEEDDVQLDKSNCETIKVVDENKIDDLEEVEIQSDDPNFNFKITVVDEQKLIQQVKCYPALYNPNCKDFAKTIVRNSVWTKIGNELNLSPKQCCFLWMNKKSTYSKYFTAVPAVKANAIQKEMHFLWTLYMKSFYNEVNLCTANNKFILDKYDKVAEGINYELIELISDYPQIYKSNSSPQDIGPYQIEVWENIGEELDQSIRSCYQRFLRLRKHYLEVLTEKFEFPNEKSKITTKFEFRMKFMWKTIRKLFPNAPHDYYDNIQFYENPVLITIPDRTNSPELIIPDEEPIYHDRDKEPDNVPEIQYKYSDELKKNLINIVEAYPVLYMGLADGPANWGESTNQNVWEIISNEISCSDKECFDLWTSLRKTFAQELKRVTSDSSHNITWEFFDDMQFLMPHIKDKIVTLITEKARYEQEIMEICKTKEDEVLKLIPIVQKHPVLYMPTGKKYIDSNIRKYKHRLWKSITADMKWHDNKCRDVWRYISKKYFIFLKTNYKDDEIDSYREALSFLNEYIIQRNSEIISSEDEDENIENTNEQQDDIEKSIIEHQISTRFEHQRLLNCVIKHKNLYDYVKFNYADEDTSWKSISTELEIPENTCIDTWRKLRRRYLISNRKFRAQTTEEDRFYFHYMSFLKPFIDKYEKEENGEDDSDCEDIVDHIEFPSEETKAEIVKILLEEVKKYPKMYLDSENTEYAKKAWEIVSQVVQIPASTCELLFIEAVDSYKNLCRKPYSNRYAIPFQLYDDMHFLRSHIESDLKKSNIDNCKKLIKTIRNYRSLYSSDIAECKNSIIWNIVADEMAWTNEDCIAQWKKIKDEFAERIGRKTFNKHWIFRDDLIFLKLSLLFDELSNENLPSITEDDDLNLLVNEIKKFPCLYDSALRTSKKEVIWDVIGKQAKLSAEECKRFWGRLSSIYFKYMDKKFKEPPNNGCLAKFEIEMQFLKPFHKKSIILAKAIKDNVFRKENSFIAQENTIVKVCRRRVTCQKRKINPTGSVIISLDSDVSNDGSNDEIILSDNPTAPVEAIAKNLMQNNSNLGYDFFSITNLYSDSESDNDNVDVLEPGPSSNRNNINHPKQSNLEQYFYSAHNIVKKLKK